MKKTSRRKRRPTAAARRNIKALLFGRSKPTAQQEAEIDKAIDRAYRYNPERKTRKARELPTGRAIKGTLRIVRRGRRRLMTFQPDRKP